MGKTNRQARQNEVWGVRAILARVPCCLALALVIQICFGCQRGGDVRPPSNAPMQRLYESEFRLTPSGSTICKFAFSPDGQLLAGSNWSEIRLWTFPEG